MSELNASNLRKEHGNEGPDLVGVTELTSPYFMVPPSGTTAQRPQNPEPGTLRFNTDSGTLEFFRGDTIGWENIVRTTPNLNGGARGIFAMSYQPGVSNRIEYVTISTLGDATDFGDLVKSRKFGDALSSSIRGVHFGGYDGSNSLNIIDYVTIASTGNATDFGDTIDTTIRKQGCSNATRGVIPSGDSPSTKKGIEFVTISTLGNSILFGELTVARRGTGSVASPIRAVFMGGEVSPAKYNVMDYVQIASTGNAVDFGDLTTAGAENGILHASGNSSSNCHGGL